MTVKSQEKRIFCVLVDIKVATIVRNFLGNAFSDACIIFIHVILLRYLNAIITASNDIVTCIVYILVLFEFFIKLLGIRMVNTD